MNAEISKKDGAICSELPTKFQETMLNKYLPLGMTKYTTTGSEEMDNVLGYGKQRNINCSTMYRGIR